MLQRAALLVAVLLLVVLAMQGWGSGYVSMRLQKVANRPYLVMEHVEAESEPPLFTIYTPKGNNWSEWESVGGERTGPANGVFVAPPAPPAPSKDNSPTEKPAEKRDERLGILHEQRATIYDVKTSPLGQVTETLPFDWIAECGVTLKGKSYVFGVQVTSVEETLAKGELKVARYDGQKWEELKIKSPIVEVRPPGFALQAAEYLDGARIFWRGYEMDQALGRQVEGLRVTTHGTLMMASFDGEKFDEKTVAFNNLPRGNTSIWAEGDQIKTLIQTRLKLEDALASNGPMEIWQLSQDGSTKQLETIEGSNAKRGLLAFIAAEHLNWDGGEYIVRSNWQSFEVWRKSSEGRWEILSQNPAGLHTYDLETPLLGVLGLCATLIAFGAGLAYQRRKQALSMLRKIQAHEIYGSIGLRSGAYAVDLFLVLALTCLLNRVSGATYVSPLHMLDITSGLHWPFYFVYMVYFVAGEWLFGSTVGKGLMGLSVVMDSGERLSFWSAIVRSLIGFFERHPSVAIFIAMPMIILGPRRQRIGDVLSRTVVVQRGALDAFKTQRSMEDQQRAQKNADFMLLPPVTSSWEKANSRDKESAGKDDDKGSRS